MLKKQIYSSPMNNRNADSKDLRPKMILPPRSRIGIGVVLLLLAIFLFIFVRDRKTQFSIELRAEGFYPSELNIPVGSTVTFKTNTAKAFWPASNFHPSHKLYPDFDAKAPIAATASYPFVFDKAGVWRYHDHLNSRNTGTIIVREKLFTKGNNPCHDPTLGTKDVKTQEVCWIQEIEEILAKEGIDRAFEKFGQLYETKQAFSSDCHDVTHLLGEAAYRAYAKDRTVITSEKTAYCGYGFYHGFIEALLFTTGNFEEAKAYCRATHAKLSETVVKPNAIYSCFHGLGHGTFDTQSYAKWGSDEGMMSEAIQTCEAVTMGEEQELVKQCATGVFNALANAYNNNTYNLTLQKANPLGICERQTNEEYKKACFREVAYVYIISLSDDRGSRLHTISQMPDRVGANAAMYAFMSEEARLGMDTESLASFAASCESLSATDLKVSCAEGVATGLFLWGKPGVEHKNALAFCSEPALGTDARDACMIYIVSRISTVNNKESFQKICETIDPEYRKYCI